MRFPCTRDFRTIKDIDEGALKIGDPKVYTILRVRFYAKLMVSSLIVGSDPLMVEKNAGHVVNIGSVAGITVYPKGNVYCASKFAVDAITQGTNIDLAGTNIRVTEIDPGATLTNFTLTRFHGDQEKSDKSYEGYQPMGGVDIARAIMFALESPPNVNIQRIVMTPTAQRNPYVIAKKL